MFRDVFLLLARERGTTVKAGRTFGHPEEEILEIHRYAMAFEDIPKKDWYSILGAGPSDSLTELKRKYQRLILLYHPDKQSTDVPAGEAEARMQRFIEIDRAWKILGNEETKKEYDLQRREYELEQGWPVDTQVSFEDMTWNHNDHCYSFTCRCGGKYRVSKNEVEDVSLVSCDTCSLLIEII